VELDALDGHGGVAQTMMTPSVLVAVTPSTAGPIRGDDEGVVAGGHEGLGQATEDPRAAVVDLRGLPVHQGGRRDDPPAEDLPDALVAEADAEDRDRAAQGGDHLHGDAGVVGTARPGEIKMASGASALMPATEIASLR